MKKARERFELMPPGTLGRDDLIGCDPEVARRTGMLSNRELLERAVSPEKGRGPIRREPEPERRSKMQATEPKTVQQEGAGAASDVGVTEEFMTFRDVADRWKCSTRTVRRLIELGELAKPLYLVPSRPLLRLSDVLAYEQRKLGQRGSQS